MEHLHVHGYHSLMDGLNSPEEIVIAKKAKGFKAACLTDHGTLSGIRDLQKACREHGLKPIIGQEMYISATDRFDRRTVKKRDDNTQLYNHVIVLAIDQSGLENLHTLSRLAWTEGFYSKPRIDSELLETYNEGLIVLSGCLNSVIVKAIESGDLAAAYQWCHWYKRVFGDRFYIEVQPHNPRIINETLLELADELQIQPVLTADCHFAHAEDRATEEAMLILSTGQKPAKGKTYNNTKGNNDFERFDALYPERPISFADLDVYILTEQEARDRMAAQGFTREDIYDNSTAIANRIGVYDYHEGLDLLPSPIEGNPDISLVRAAKKGLRERAEAQGFAENTGKLRSYEERLTQELEVIKDKNFSTYFLVVADVVREARKRNILVGPGRGSAAGSLLCYVLGITEVDPIEHDLLFFRFIDPTRADYPDIDVDFEDKRRGEMKEYMRQKYGHVASISTFVYWKDKGVIRDAARAFAVDLTEVNNVLKKVPDNTPYDMIETMPVMQDFFKEYPEVRELSRKLRNRIKTKGMHAAGLVVSKEPIELYAPIETAKDTGSDDRVPVVAYDMDTCAEIGLIKMDLLGLSNLSVIHDCMDMIESRHGIKIDPTKIDLNDPATMQMLNEGKVAGVFQAETAFARLLPQVGITKFEDIVITTSLVRPGAMNTVGDVLLRRKRGDEEVAYVHEKVQPFLERSYGVAIYQEQVMQIAVALGGLSMVEANKMRNIIGKKKDMRLFDEFKDKFVKGASEYISEKDAEKLWHDFEAHSGYSFNRSHAVAYSMLTVWTAWFKLHYPLEYMCALLKNEGDKDKRTEFLIDAKRMGLKILLPHVNKSDYDFALEEDAIRFGLTNIKYISDKVAEPLVQNRPYTTFKELLDLSEKKYSGVNSRTLQALNAVGAAVFPDNPRRGDEADNFYEYLTIPKFPAVDWPAHVNTKVTEIEQYEEGDAAVLLAMVKHVKRGKGWSLVELVDETGTVGIFHDEQTQIMPGNMYFILTAGKRISEYSTAEHIWKVLQKEEKPNNAFDVYLTTDVEVKVGQHFLVKFAKRVTKARQLMGNMVLVNHEGKIKDVVVFASAFPQAWEKAKQGPLLRIATNPLKDGGECLGQIVTAERP